MPHRIRRLRVRARARSREEAFALRSRLRDVVGEVVLPALEQMFDELAPGDEVVHVPELELHATVSRVEELASVLRELVRRELAGARATGIEPRSTGEAMRTEAPPPGPSVDPAAERRGAPASRDAAAEAEVARRGAADGGVTARAVEHRSTRGDRALAIAHYLETGAFPWHVDAEDGIRASIADLSIEELARAAATCTAERSTASPAVVFFRLLQLVPQPRWTAVARAILAAIGEPEAAPAIEAVAALAATGDLARHVLLRVAAAAIAAARTGPARIEADRIVTLLAGTEDAAAARTIVETELERLPPPVAAFFRHRLAPAAGSPGAPPVATIAPGPTVATPASLAPTPLVPGPTVDTPASPAPTPPAPAPPAPASMDAARRTLASAPAPTPPASAPAAAKRPAEEPFGIPARHAGLILLHPFLSRLFENTRVKRPGRSALDPPALPRAAALLHACAAGDAEPFEYELSFIKLLLGLSPEAPLLVAGGLLSAADREEIDGLLRAVIDHWGVLKKTTPHGLRSAFLRRGGLVREEARGLRLQVEPAGFDVLLAHLPWGLATVKLPWIPKALFTEWRGNP